MKTHLLSTSMTLPLGINQVFPFFGDASNLEWITPPELCFRIVTPQPLEINEGTVIDYRLRLFGVPFRWQTRISLWDPPHAFVDEQTSGPYRLWIHLHRFRQAQGSTTILDEVHYQLPLWPWGEIVHPLVRKQLERIFGFRRKAIQTLMLRKRPD
jgi:ligand-binding SRPBCC domain-containing protein